MLTLTVFKIYGLKPLLGLASTAKEKMVFPMVKISRVFESVKLLENCVNAVFKGQGRETSDEYSILGKMR